MFKWLWKKLQDNAISNMRTDIENFISLLKSEPEKDIGFVVAMCAVTRITYANEGLLSGKFLECENAAVAELFCVDALDAAWKLQKHVSLFQKQGQALLVTPTMVWIHSLRSMSEYEIRHLGKEMWSELVKGFPYAEEALKGLESQITVPNGAKEGLSFVPPVLDPR